MVRGAKGLGFLAIADHAMAEAPPLDLLVHPGGDGTRGLAKDTAHLEWLRGLQRTRGTVLASVCTGSLVLAAASERPADRPATTHRDYLDKLTKTDPSIEARQGNGSSTTEPSCTSAGASAGIDMAPRLVARYDGAEAAEFTRAGIQYEAPEPVRVRA